MNSDGRNGIGRRELLAGAGLAAAAATSGVAIAAVTATPAATNEWDMEADVVCVGSGAAAGGAAVTAASQGARTLVIEKLPLLGGTTGKSGGVAWVPNNHLLRARGDRDPREDALRYMVRLAFPQQFDPESPTLGIPGLQYRLLEAFYDNGSRAVEHLEHAGVLKFQEFRLFFVDRQAPDYADHLPENRMPRGRAIEPAVGAGAASGGNSLAARIEDWLRAKNVPILAETRVTGVVRQNGRVTGVLAKDAGGRTLRIRARKGVVFGTGGYAHNTELVGLHQTALYGSCAMSGATGDFIAIAAEAGAAMGNLGSAWRSQVVLEEALENRMLARCMDYPPGDSVLMVNKYGRRVVNEKRNYNDRTRVHFTYDPTREEYPNQLLFMIFDERSLDGFGGSYPLPSDKREARFLIEAATLSELGAKIAEHLSRIAAKTGGVRLAPDFATTMTAEVARFNAHAKQGRDPDFDRGLHDYDREWQPLWSPLRQGTKFPANPYPNITMHPLADQGPYYALILAAGALDTNSGPLINEKAQVLAHDGQPIPGLYGAGNCIASPARDAYFAGGGTIGLALAYGYIAANHALQAGGA